MQHGIGIGIPRRRKHSGQGTGFPRGLRHWWRSDDVAEAGGDVVSWTDRVGGRVLTPIAGATVGVTFDDPNWNDLPSLNFANGGLESLGSIPALDAQPGSILMVYRLTTDPTVAQQTVCQTKTGSSTTSIGCRHVVVSTGVRAHLGNGSNNVFDLNVGLPFAWQKLVVILRMDSIQANLRRNGVEVTGAITQPFGATDSAFFVGSQPNLGQPLGGDIVEILIFNRRISDEEAEQFETYALDRYDENPPAIFQQADLILDSRTGLTLAGTDITAWRNLGQGGGAVDFVGVSPFLQYDPADPAFNGRPSAEQTNNAGRVQNLDTSQLNYLHQAGPWTLVMVLDVTDNTTTQGFCQSVDGAAPGIGISLTGANALLTAIYGDAGSSVASASTAWTGAGRVVVLAMRHNAGTYTVYLDGVVFATFSPTGTISASSRGGAFSVGTNVPASQALDGKFSHFSTWDSDIGLAEIQIVTNYLLETFKP